MKRIKSTSQDELILINENADPTERVRAARCLASDGFVDLLQPTLDSWLNLSEPLLREEAITLLLGGFGYENYVDKAIKILSDDPDWLVRGDAAFALSSFAIRFREAEKYNNQIVSALFRSLLNDEDEAVQEKSYKGLYELLTKQPLISSRDVFDRDNDVDWNLLTPYLERYNLSKSS